MNKKQITRRQSQSKLLPTCFACCSFASNSNLLTTITCLCVCLCMCVSVSVCICATVSRTTSKCCCCCCTSTTFCHLTEWFQVPAAAAQQQQSQPQHSSNYNNYSNNYTHTHTPSHTRRQYPELPMTNKFATHSRKSCLKLLLLGSDSDWQSALDQQLLPSLLLLLAIGAWGRGGT